MFKLAKLEKVNNEIVSINLVTQEQSSYENGKKVSHESFKTLSFDISGDDYSFGFDLNCKLEKLLEIPMNETIDFKDHIFGGETWLNVRDLNGVEPVMDIKITRYLKNRFIIFFGIKKKQSIKGTATIAEITSPALYPLFILSFLPAP